MKYDFLDTLGITETNFGACYGTWAFPQAVKDLISFDPSTEKSIARVLEADAESCECVVAEAEKALETWRMTPAPKRGEIVRQLGNELRTYKKELGALVSLEMGKIRAEGEGEVQEMIDMCDFAVGLSRQLYGITTHSERPMHRMYEQWHPLGVVGIITAFNFPVAVWAWNAAIAAICGNTMIWKPSRETPLCAIAVQHICNRIMERNDLKGVFNLLVGAGDVIGERLITDERLPLISFTGSVKMGRHVAEKVTQRLGRVLLELGGNNAVIVLNDADLNLAARAVLFGAVGTTGQRCTTTRRLIMQKGIAGELTTRLVKAYEQLRIGDPLDPATLVGPLVNQKAVDDMMEALTKIKLQGGEVLCGGKRVDRPGFFVEPTLVKAHKNMSILREETFAPILYLLEVETVKDAIELHNNVPQGLSSAIFTTSLASAEYFLSHRGSDCGIANVNIGTSGAEIGLAFGGEKETGGGREAGSDAWKLYMRRQTCTINWSSELPLAQGITFGD